MLLIQVLPSDNRARDNLYALTQHLSLYIYTIYNIYIIYNIYLPYIFIRLDENKHVGLNLLSEYEN